MPKTRSCCRLHNAISLAVTCVSSRFQGVVDVAKEITKLDGKKEKLNSQLVKLREAMEVEDYTTKVQYENLLEFSSSFTGTLCLKINFL